jgi:aromatic ring hydroxylase
MGQFQRNTTTPNFMKMCPEGFAILMAAVVAYTKAGGQFERDFAAVLKQMYEYLATALTRI